LAMISTTAHRSPQDDAMKDETHTVTNNKN